MKKSTVIILWGIITAVADSIFYWCLNMSDNMNTGLRYISWIIVFAGLIVGTLQCRKANGGYMSFGQGYSAGILMTLIIAAVASLGFLIFVQMHPEFADKVQAQKVSEAIAKMADKNIPKEQMDMQVRVIKMCTTPIGLTIFVFIGDMLTGALVSLLTSGILAKNKPPMQEDDATI